MLTSHMLQQRRMLTCCPTCCSSATEPEKLRMEELRLEAQRKRAHVAHTFRTKDVPKRMPSQLFDTPPVVSGGVGALGQWGNGAMRAVQHRGVAVEFNKKSSV